MKARLILLAALGCCAAAGVAARRPAAEEPSPQSLSFMAASDWKRQERETKVALAADFMRVFCVRPTMLPALLADCLDGAPRESTPFDGALSCIKELQP